MNEDLADDHRANRAIRTALAERLFRGEAYRRFDVTRHAGRLPLFKIYLEEFSTLARLPPYEGMVHKVAVALARQPASATIVIRGPLDLRVLRKRG
jgi:hypothetical protein